MMDQIEKDELFGELIRYVKFLDDQNRQDWAKLLFEKLSYIFEKDKRGYEDFSYKSKLEQRQRFKLAQNISTIAVDEYLNLTFKSRPGKQKKYFIETRQTGSCTQMIESVGLLLVMLEKFKTEGNNNGQ